MCVHISLLLMNFFHIQNDSYVQTSISVEDVMCPEREGFTRMEVRMYVWTVHVSLSL